MFFYSLQYDWIIKVHQPTYEHIKHDMAVYIKYYNMKRLHSANRNMMPAEYENSLKKCPVRVEQNSALLYHTTIYFTLIYFFMRRN